ncbi:MAG: alpha/beta hydrolase-fold protein [Planctomycetota bacterium]|nr:alpha/beta hydrolase-fold protein [Planctomycetota bacterium]
MARAVVLAATVLFLSAVVWAAAAPAVEPAAVPAPPPAKQKSWPKVKAEWVDPNHSDPDGMKFKTFQSKVLGQEVSYLIYLPPGYDEGTRRYPVIYWLHGMGAPPKAGATLYVPHVDAAIKEGALPPAIVVVVNGMVNAFYCDSADGKRPLESVIIKDLVPHVDQAYRTIARREGRVIEGYSMGGYGAAHLGFKYPEVFGTVVINAGAMMRAETMGSVPGGFFQDVWGGSRERYQAEHPAGLARKNADQLRGRTHIRIGVGSLDNLLRVNQDLHELLGELKVEHQYEVVPDVAHNSGLYYQKLGSKFFEFHRKVFEALGAGK